MKKGQSASSAATLIIVIAGFILLYILFLPAAEREALLQDDYTYGPGGSYDGPGGSGDSYGLNPAEQRAAVESLVGDAIYQASPGRVSFISEDSFEHEISAVNLYTTTEAKVLFSQDSLYVKNGMFDALDREVTFYLEDPEYTEDVLFSFNVGKAKGRLQIRLNGDIILDGALTEGNAEPLVLDPRSLSDVNVLEFSVSEVGYQFWTTNEYQLEDLTITGDVTDVSQQQSQTTFTVTDTEKHNMERARLYFYPDCVPRAVGALTIRVNYEVVYSSIPDCQQINMVEFSPTTLSAGENNLVFQTEKGEYLIYSISVKTDLEEQEFPTYYFEMDEDLFVYSEELNRDRFSPDYECGETDGFCPAGCGEDNDPDCCFEGLNKYWCDVSPTDADMRCASISESDVSKCDLCPSGYEDDRGYAPDECEDRCGDDHDDYCPVGCSKYYDKDCCYEEDEDNFWCDEVPTFGLSDVCETSLSEEECEHCPSGYESDSGDAGYCPGPGASDWVEVYDFFPGYNVFVVFTFVDNVERKTADIYVNGHKFFLDTYDDEYVRQITQFVEPETNAVKIEPTRTIEIRKMEIVVEEKN